MQIKPNEGAGVARLASIRPAPHGQLALEARPGNVQVSLSETVRALAGALTHELLDLHDLRLGDRLTSTDQLTLARVSELVRSEQLDPNEVVKLALDLSRYRTHSTAPSSQAAALLALPTFSPRDEALARTILSSVALRTTLLERGFVRTLLDPDQTPEHAVDFEFLRRVVVALSAAPGDATLEPTASFVRREARAALARAIEALALPHAELPRTLDAGVALGAALVRRRLPALLARADAHGSAAPPPSAPDQLSLGREDRGLLGMLYAAAYARGRDLTAVDEVARALVRLRALERADSQARAEAVAQAEPTNAARDPGTATGGVAAGDPQAEPQPRAAHPTPHALDEELPAPLAHGFGSATQRAARASGTYRSLTPPSLTAPSLALHGAPAGAAEAAATTPASTRAPRAFALLTPARPLDLAGALGLSALVREVRAQTLRTARARLPARHSDAVRALEAPGRAAAEADADDPILNDSPRRRRVRWRLLHSRRRRARAQGARIA
jgi:hypothetical protein